MELLIETVKKLKAAGTAIIFSSHNMKNVAEVSDQLLMLVNGNQRLYGPIDEIRSRLVKPRSTWKAFFDNLLIEELPGMMAIDDDYPGKVITFDSELHVKQAIDRARHLIITWISSFTSNIG